MPYIPKKSLTASSVGILNSIRNSASPEYQAGVPLAKDTTDSIRMVGESINAFQSRQNEFINALVNRIGRVMVASRSYQNPWAFFKKGILSYGETIEEVFVNIANVHQFDPDNAYMSELRKETNDIRSAFHTMNYQKFYKATTSPQQLSQAFLSADGVTDLITRIIESMHTAMQYDELLVMRYMIARLALDGKIETLNIDTVTQANARGAIAKIKAISNDYTFMLTDHNMAHVLTHTPKNEQYLISTTNFDAIIDVEVLALAFNMDKTEFLGHHVLINSFSFTTAETERLEMLLSDDPGYTSFTTAENNLLKLIEALLVDINFFMVLDNLLETRNKEIDEGLYWNHWLHTWKTFSASPFANATLITSAESSVTSVEFYNTETAFPAGYPITIQAGVNGNGFFDKSVRYSISGNLPETKIDGKTGLLIISKNEADGAEITITATSVYDRTKTATLEITVINK